MGQVLAAYAELDAVTADIPAGLAAAEQPETIRKSHNKKLIQRGTAAGGGCECGACRDDSGGGKRARMLKLQAAAVAVRESRTLLKIISAPTRRW